MTKIIGITGGIGSGKSTLSDYLKKKDFLIHESDHVVSNIYKRPNKQLVEFIKKTKLKSAFVKGRIEKKIITKIIFNNKGLREKLEKHIHKEVAADRKKFIKRNLKTKKKAIFIDIPLLLENSLEKNFDLVISIISTRKNRIKRVLKNKKFSIKVLKNILKIQTTDKERRARSNIIINNNETKKKFILNVEKVLKKILK